MIVDATINAHLAYMKFQEEINVDNELDTYLEKMGWKKGSEEEKT